MKISTSNLDAFLAVARLGRFAKAAETLGLSQSALSQRVLNLESELETTLFVRDRAGSRLTPEGEALLRHAQTLERLEDDYLKERKSETALAGSLRIGAFSSVARSLLLPALAPLMRENPVRLSIFSRELSVLPSLLRSGEADLILLENEPAREGVDGVFLGYEENVLVRARRFKGACEFYLDHDSEDLTTHRYFQKFGPKGKKLERRFLDEVYGLLDGVRLGLGMAILPLHLVSDDKDLEIMDAEKLLRIPVWLQYPAQSWYPKLQIRAREEIVAFAKKVLAAK